MWDRAEGAGAVIHALFRYPQLLWKAGIAIFPTGDPQMWGLCIEHRQLLGDSRMLDKIKDWYEGNYVPYKNEPGSDVFLFGGEHERHWSASVVRIFVGFYLREWKWCWGTVFAVAGLYLGLKKLGS